MFRPGVEPGTFREVSCEAKIITTRPPKLHRGFELYIHKIWFTKAKGRSSQDGNFHLAPDDKSDR